MYLILLIRVMSSGEFMNCDELIKYLACFSVLKYNENVF